ncbi:MAG: hypothetical protein A3H02_00255 [Candidatus Niyogibacteria bacterium RIFCSPLOWO2_12_FULL_41_13]|uniref:Peptidase S11 D-alanyl-D-alanine carboxypeptidase A N-terminal domain-containing protein n=1 Tax=Candidatus Niyogibacteria bacterium RIFCSPLOWO2_12_FULL_41_13 TaxID=1801726 RepID=A0A1G2F4K9_9BACT|nr:MAG: hypothetical protein A3H02_00255 [Candidatus Niyogibacteria bacterium RIFCSPLOWO2_12_FULL_41_13]
MSKFSLFFSFFILTLLINFKASYLYLGKPEYKTISKSSAVLLPNQVKTEDKERFFKPPAIAASSALAMRLSDEKIIFEKNSDAKLPLASLTKLMTAYAAEKSKGKQNNFEVLIPITKEAVNQEGDDGLILNEVFRSSVLRDIMLLGSSNDAARALAGQTDKFVESMNKEAKNLGLKNTQFFNPTGLDISKTESGALGTAEDLAKLVLAILKNYPYIFNITTREEAELLSENGFSHKIKNTNKLVFEIPGLIGGKTGFSDLAGGNLIIIADLSFNEPYLFIVLNSTYEGRFEDMKNLYQFVKEL